jgi:hypothetical protein
MSLLWTRAVRDPDDLGYYGEPHEDHLPSPALAEAGITNSPCTGPGCTEYDEEHDKASWEAHDKRAGAPTRILPPDHPLSGMETHIDPETVARYGRGEPRKGLPLVFRHRGRDHILDGHHRLIADRVDGRPTEVRYVDMDKEG